MFSSYVIQRLIGNSLLALAATWRLSGGRSRSLWYLLGIALVGLSVDLLDTFVFSSNLELLQFYFLAHIWLAIYLFIPHARFKWGMYLFGVLMIVYSILIFAFEIHTDLLNSGIIYVSKYGFLDTYEANITRQVIYTWFSITTLIILYRSIRYQSGARMDSLFTTICFTLILYYAGSFLLTISLNYLFADQEVYNDLIGFFYPLIFDVSRVVFITGLVLWKK